MKNERGKKDYNFDGFVKKFENAIYGTLKGEWRLKLLKEDLEELHQSTTALKVWDAGCGLGQLSLWFAQNGHQLTSCDISYKMLEKTKERLKKEGLEATFYQAPAQEIASKIAPQDLVLFHAVIEWVAKPLEVLEAVSNAVENEGYLSLLFFNQHSLVFKNAMRGEWRLKNLLNNQWYGKGKKLTPPHPQKPEDMIKWLKEHGYTIKRQTAIRVFHDYMSQEVIENSKIDEILALEYRYCRVPTFVNMGRYIHILAQKREK